MKVSLLSVAALHALGTAVYVSLVSLFLFYAPQIFGSGPDKSILIPIAMLLLFLCSAAATGSLVLGRPILWYLDGKKKEAVSLFLTTLGFLFLIMILAFLGLVSMGK